MPVHGLPKSRPTSTKCPSRRSGRHHGASFGSACWYANVISYRWNIAAAHPTLARWIPSLRGHGPLRSSAPSSACSAHGSPAYTRLQRPAFRARQQRPFFICIEASDPKYDTEPTRLFRIAQPSRSGGAEFNRSVERFVGHSSCLLSCSFASRLKRDDMADQPRLET